MNLSIPSWTSQPEIPIQFACPSYGKNISPSISWTPVKNTQSYALILQDPDANDFVHWYIPSISPSIHSMDELEYTPQNISNLASFYLSQSKNSLRMKQGINSHQTFGYFGPCAPKGTGIHRYQFYLYALDKDIYEISKENQQEIKSLFLPKKSHEFEELLQQKNIQILQKDSITGHFQAP
jgi:Raf kinase inhibitor-like YbhB/YbcL family protein